MTTFSTELARVDEARASPAGLYLRDIAAVTLLTAEQEVELAQLIEAGKSRLLFPQEFNTVRGWTERCAACPEKKKQKKRA